MRYFIKKFIFFSFILFVINLCFYLVVDVIYYKPYNNNINTEYRSFLLSDSHGLALGNLTEDYGIYNFSRGGDSYYDFNRKVKYLIKNNLVDTIYLTVDDHTLSYYREKMNNIDRSIIYTDKSDYDSAYLRFTDNYIKRFIVLLNPKARTILKRYLLNRLLNSNNHDVKETWETMSLENRRINAQNRVGYQFPDLRRSYLLKESLENIIEVCKRNNIDLIGVKFPITRVYNELISNKSSKADSVMLKYENKILDFKETYLDENSYFKNEDHLNVVGGLKFSNHFKEAIKSN